MAVPQTTTTPIDIGIAPNDGNGDPIRTGGDIINDNTLKLFNLSNKVDNAKMQVFKYPTNSDISTTEQNDFVHGIVVDGLDKYFIEAQYNTGSITDFGTVAGNFNDGSYVTFKYRKIN